MISKFSLTNCAERFLVSTLQALDFIWCTSFRISVYRQDFLVFFLQFTVRWLSSIICAITELVWICIVNSKPYLYNFLLLFSNENTALCSGDLRELQTLFLYLIINFNFWIFFSYCIQNFIFVLWAASLWNS